MSGVLRLDRFLAEAGCGTRSEVKKMILKGQVTVNQAACRKPETKIDIDRDLVMLSGTAVQLRRGAVWYLMNKPAGFITATEDQRERTVMELVPDAGKGLFPVGRLDKDTEGLLLVTNDGAAAHRLLSPAKHVPKTYYVEAEGRLGEEELTRLREGVDIGEEKPTRRAEAEPLPEKDGRSRLLLTISEGKFHQVKRMLHAVGCEVVYLKRVSMGGLSLPEDLKTGECRLLTEEELKRLLEYDKENLQA